MIRLIRENVVFFTLFTFFLYASLYFLFVWNKGEELFFFSDRRTVIGDFFFKYWTLMGEAYIYIVLTFVFIFYGAKKEAIAVPLLGGLVSLVAYFSKHYAHELRPFSFFKKLGLLDKINFVHDVELNTGFTSFPSGHTMSAFAIYSLLAFWHKDKQGMATLFFFMAFLVAISRIYLIQHFLIDVFFGSMIGVLLSMLVYHVQWKRND